MTVKEMFLGTRDSFEYGVCPTCGSLSIRELPANLKSYYTKYHNLACKKATFNRMDKHLFSLLLSSKRRIFYKVISKYYQRSPYLKTEEFFRISAFSRYATPRSAKILDVGCGTGDFLLRLSQLGFNNLHGTDPFIDFDGTKGGNIKLSSNKFIDINEQFDRITFHHSFEHMTNPQSVLSHIKHVLNPNGIAIVRVPNVDSYSFRKFRCNWEGIHAPFHVFLPSQAAMSAMVKKARLQIASVEGEQMEELFYNSISHSLDVSDYDALGLRNHFERYPKNSIPLLLSKHELDFWKGKTRQLHGTSLADWVTYYIKH